MLSLITQGVSLGFTAGASPGPLQSYLISTTLAQGWRKSLIVIVTPLIADIPIILLTVVILKDLPAGIVRAVQIVGGAYLLWIAYTAWRQFRKGVTLVASETTVQRTLGQALLITWLSPGPYIFWGTINGPLLIGALALSVWHGVAFVLAFYGTFVSLLALYVIVFDRMRSLNPRILQGVIFVTLIVLVVFGLSLIGQGLGVLSS